MTIAFTRLRDSRGAQISNWFMNYEKYWKMKTQIKCDNYSIQQRPVALYYKIYVMIFLWSHFPSFLLSFDNFPCKCTTDQFLPPKLPISLTSCRQDIINLHLYWTKRPWCSPKALYCSSVVNMDHDSSFLCLQCAEITLAGVSPFEGII